MKLKYQSASVSYIFCQFSPSINSMIFLQFLSPNNLVFGRISISGWVPHFTDKKQGKWSVMSLNNIPDTMQFKFMLFLSMLRTKIWSMHVAEKSVILVGRVIKGRNLFPSNVVRYFMESSFSYLIISTLISPARIIVEGPTIWSIVLSRSKTKWFVFPFGCLYIPPTVNGYVLIQILEITIRNYIWDSDKFCIFWYHLGFEYL